MIDFPSSPSVGQIVTSGGNSWRWDGTKWVSMGVTPGNTLATPAECQLQFISPTQIRLVPKNGQLIKINGSLYPIPSAGVNLSNAGLSANTLYYIYAWNNAGVLTLEAAGGAPSSHVPDTTAGNVGVEIRSGMATRSLVGMVYANASSQFQQDGTAMYVASWFNRIAKTTNGAGGSGSFNGNGAYVVLSGTVGQFITWPDELVSAELIGSYFSSVQASNQVQGGINLDGGGSPAAGSTSSYWSHPTATTLVANAATFQSVLTEGRHTLGCSCYSQQNAAVSFAWGVQIAVRA